MPVPRMTKEDLKARLEGDPASAPMIVDARLKYPYEHSTVTLPGAIRMMPDAPDPSMLSRDREIVTYDSDPEELAAAHLAATLIHQGFSVAALKGGITDWLAASFPTNTKEAPQMAPPKAGALKG